MVDGHTRLRAAIKAGQKTISSELREFVDLEAAMQFAYNRQKSRRNITGGQLVMAVVKARESRKGKDQLSTKDLSKMIGFSTSQVDFARQLVRRGKSAEIQVVLDGDASLKTAYLTMKKRENKKDDDVPLLPDPKIEPEDDGSGGFDMSATPAADDGPENSPEYEAARDMLGDLMDAAGELEHYLAAGERVTTQTAIKERMAVVDARYTETQSALSTYMKLKPKIAAVKAAKKPAKKGKAKA